MSPGSRTRDEVASCAGRPARRRPRGLVRRAASGADPRVLDVDVWGSFRSWPIRPIRPSREIVPDAVPAGVTHEGSPRPPWSRNPRVGAGALSERRRPAMPMRSPGAPRRGWRRRRSREPGEHPGELVRRARRRRGRAPSRSRRPSRPGCAGPRSRRSAAGGSRPRPGGPRPGARAAARPRRPASPADAGVDLVEHERRHVVQVGHARCGTRASCARARRPTRSSRAAAAFCPGDGREAELDALAPPTARAREPDPASTSIVGAGHAELAAARARAPRRARGAASVRPRVTTAAADRPARARTRSASSVELREPLVGRGERRPRARRCLPQEREHLLLASRRTCAAAPSGPTRRSRTSSSRAGSAASAFAVGADVARELGEPPRPGSALARPVPRRRGSSRGRLGERVRRGAAARRRSERLADERRLRLGRPLQQPLDVREPGLLDRQPLASRRRAGPPPRSRGPDTRAGRARARARASPPSSASSAARASRHRSHVLAVARRAATRCASPANRSRNPVWVAGDSSRCAWCCPCTSTSDAAELGERGGRSRAVRRPARCSCRRRSPSARAGPRRPRPTRAGAARSHRTAPGRGRPSRPRGRASCRPGSPERERQARPSPSSCRPRSRP